MKKERKEGEKEWRGKEKGQERKGGEGEEGKEEEGEILKVKRECRGKNTVRIRNTSTNIYKPCTNLLDLMFQSWK